MAATGALPETGSPRSPAAVFFGSSPGSHVNMWKQALWSSALVGMTVGAMVLVTVALFSWAYASTALGVLATVWMVTVLFFSPFFLVPLHFRLQVPRESNAGLAFLTGLASWLVAAAYVASLNLSTFGS